MNRATALVACIAPLFAFGGAVAGPSMPDIDLKIQVAVPQHAITVGSQSEAVVTFSPPAGIHINQYPPMRLTIEKSPPLVFDQSEIKLGLDKMPEDIETNPFVKIDPIRVKFTVGNIAGDASVAVKGTLKYFYCVAKSGYCAPGVKSVTFNVPVTSGR